MSLIVYNLIGFDMGVFSLILSGIAVDMAEWLCYEFL
jgi:hypothetical protein